MGVRPSCCETPKEETSKVKKNIKKYLISSSDVAKIKNKQL